jgi:hypothetical protein
MPSASSSFTADYVFQQQRRMLILVQLTVLVERGRGRSGDSVASEQPNPNRSGRPGAQIYELIRGPGGGRFLRPLNSAADLPSHPNSTAEPDLPGAATECPISTICCSFADGLGAAPSHGGEQSDRAPSHRTAAEVAPTRPALIPTRTAAWTPDSRGRCAHGTWTTASARPAITPESGDPSDGTVRILVMPATAPAASSSDLPEAIRRECERALRRLDILIRERDDVLLDQVREFVRHAAALAAAQANPPRRHGE